MSNYKHFKHYYDPYDSLDVEWQNVVSKGHLTIREVVSLSGYTKSYVYRLVKDGVIPCMNGKSGKQVRHSFAMALLNKGTDIYSIAKLMGHRSVTSTQIYAKLSDGQLRKAILKL